MSRSFRREIPLFLAIWLLVGRSFSWADNLKITIFHTNDIHGWIMSRPSYSYSPDPQRLIGGAAALSNVVKREKGPKLLLDGGDWFQGTPEGNLSRGQALVDIFNFMAYDAVAVGNHDFDFGKDRLKELVKAMKVPVLSANVYRLSDHKRVDYLKPWIVKDVGGVKVGIFGLLTGNMKNLAFAEDIAGLEFRREVDEAREAVRTLRRQGATVIIALTHMGFESPQLGSFEGDQTFASRVEGIDLIVGGHTHTFLKEPLHEATHGTLIAQAGTALSHVGKVILEVDPRTGKVVSSNGGLVDLWLDQAGEDPAVLEILRPHVQVVGRVYDVVIATAAAALLRNREGESALGDWMTDCSQELNHSDIAIQNSGGIRADMASGPVTVRTIFNIMPFDNYVVNLKMNGRLVKEVLEHGVGRTKGIIQVSGLSFSYNRDKPKGERISDIFVKGKPLDLEASYRVSTVDFLVQGGDGYMPFAAAQSKEMTRSLYRDVLRQCAQKHPLILPPTGGRMHSLEDPYGDKKYTR